MTERSYEQELNLPSAREFRFPFGVLISVRSSEEELRSLVGRTAATNQDDDDDWSDENLRMWEEEDKLDPELAQWLQAQRGE
jgi:hypothetical protein